LRREFEERCEQLKIPKEEAKEILVTLMDAGDYRKWLRENPLPSETKRKTELNGGDCQRIVSEEELGGYLAKGWKVQAVLPSGRIVVDNEH